MPFRIEGGFRVDDTPAHRALREALENCIIKFGVPNIFSIWEDEEWEEPDIKEDFDPDRTSLTLKFIKKEAIKSKR
ncbi:MAG: hypothetical protein K1W34_11605 [Lachnospiraceae bacterium]